jgi:hypothetical protein
MPEQKITLAFPSLRHLWDFTQAIDNSSIEVIAATCTLFCNCKAADVQLAKERYGAFISESTAFSKS